VSTARVDFTRGAAERIARVVRIVEQGDRDGAALRFGKVVESGGGGKTFRMCRFSSAWSIDTTATLTFRNVTTTPNTVIAHNVFATIGLGTATASDCAIAKDGTAWYLIAARCP
jgi:hypothetical protein